jgi:hypothetical protein
MLTPNVLDSFAMLDTADQAAALRAAGLETEAADRALGHVRANYPDRAAALLAMLDREGSL